MVKEQSDELQVRLYDIQNISDNNTPSIIIVHIGCKQINKISISIVLHLYTLAIEFVVIVSDRKEIHLFKHKTISNLVMFFICVLYFFNPASIRVISYIVIQSFLSRLFAIAARNLSLVELANGRGTKMLR
jgi:hypothetical protein